MRLKNIELHGFKSFAKKVNLDFDRPIVSVVGPNGSGKSNVVEAFRFVLGEQSIKSMRGKSGSDLIFKGSKKLPKSSRASVTIHFDNKDRVFKIEGEAGENIDLSYDTISISREVFPDGVNKYSLNGTDVRLKDINALLSSVNIGASGHHIISQGEADRILNASSRDRKEMVEDALGLKVYQYKIKEAERKLEKSSLNLKEISMLRRENAPHLKFLKTQVEKIEKAKELKMELSLLYKEYLKKESVYLENTKSTILEEKHRLKAELEELNLFLREEGGGEEEKENEKLNNLKLLEEKLNEIRHTKNEIERKLGRIEGMIEMEEVRASEHTARDSFGREEIEKMVVEIEEFLDSALAKESIDEIKVILQNIKTSLRDWDKSGGEAIRRGDDLKTLRVAKESILTEVSSITEEEKKLGREVVQLKEAIQRDVEATRDLEREKFAKRVKHQEIHSALKLNAVKEESLLKETQAFEQEIREGAGFVGGGEILSYKHFDIGDFSPTDKSSQEELRRKIERIKIKLEDSALGNGDEILKEYRDMSERDEFLVGQMEDVSKSILSLEQLIISLKEKVDVLFKEGIQKINVEFKQFFALMFGGGHGELLVVKESRRKRGEEESAEEEVEEEGIEINVALPHKKVKELQSLSGGERSLTSIALLFAMSQVNPPPFLILDETDAALDEANSRKYGDMLERLSKHSELIVVTHNRETMSRAGVLYGVTIGEDGASKLLSIKFDEAVAIAK